MTGKKKPNIATILKGSRVTFAEADAQAAKFWEGLQDQLQELSVGTMPPDAERILRAIAKHSFIAGAGWMHTEAEQRRARVADELLHALIVDVPPRPHMGDGHD